MIFGWQSIIQTAFVCQISKKVSNNSKGDSVSHQEVCSGTKMSRYINANEVLISDSKSICVATLIQIFYYNKHSFILIHT